MGGKNIGLVDQVRRFSEGHPFTDVFQRPFEGQEGGMPFVHVPGGGCISQSPQGPYTAHPQQNLLGNAQFQITDVKPVGQLAIVGVVIRDVGVKQVQLDPPYIQLVDPRIHLAPGQVNRDLHGLAVRIQQEDQGKVFKVDLDIFSLLPAVFTDALREVAVGVYKPHRHQGDSQVAGLFEVIAG